MRLELPIPSVVLLVGASGAGKSTFARRHFLPTEILSSDAFRALITDDEDDQSATSHAFFLLNYVAERRLRWRRLVVVDATNVERAARRSWMRLARKHGVPALAIVLDLPAEVLAERARGHRAEGVSEAQLEELRQSIETLEGEGFDRLVVLRSPTEVDAVMVERPLLGHHRPAP